MDAKHHMVLSLILVLLVGCTGIQFGKTKEQAAAIIQDTHVGVRGVTLNFVKNNPPDIAYTGTSLSIVVQLQNEGAAQAAGTLYLTGYDENIFTLSGNTKTFALDGKSRFNTIGGIDTAEFTSSKDLYLPLGTETLKQPFIISACYNYGTQASIPVCIDPNPVSLLENEVCSVAQPIAVGGGQGGPVSVSAVKENAAPGQTSFLITISNLGDGQVISQPSQATCLNPNYNDVDQVTYSVILSNTNGDCTPHTLKLANKQATLYCKFPLTSSTGPAYTSVLQVNLNYGYLSQKTKEITIKSLT